MKREGKRKEKKRKDIVTHATTWTNLEDMTLSEMNQTQKDKYRYDSTYTRDRE